MPSHEAFEKDADSSPLIYEFIDEKGPIKRRGPETRPLDRADNGERLWRQPDDVDVLPTKHHVNRRFDELQRTVCSAVGVLQQEVTALKYAITSAGDVNSDASGTTVAEKVGILAGEAGNLSRPDLCTLFELISEFEIVPLADVAAIALAGLKDEDSALRAAAAGALGVIRPAGATPALATAFESESNRHVKRIIARSLKASIQ